MYVCLLRLHAKLIIMKLHRHIVKSIRRDSLYLYSGEAASGLLVCHNTPSSMSCGQRSRQRKPSFKTRQDTPFIF